MSVPLSGEEPQDPVFGDYEQQGAEGPITQDSSGNAFDWSRPQLQNEDGSISTERSITFEQDGRWWNVPTIVQGEQLDPEQAIQSFREGSNVPTGYFDSEEAALKAAKNRSRELGFLLQRTPGEIPGIMKLEGDQDPEARARALRVSAQTGLPLNLVEADVKNAEAFADLKRLSVDQIMEQYPRFAEFANDPKNTLFAKDDYDPLVRLEREMWMQDKAWWQWPTDLAVRGVQGLQELAQGAGGLADMSLWSIVGSLSNPLLKALGKKPIPEEDTVIFSKDLQGTWADPNILNKYLSREAQRKQAMSQSLPWDARILYNLQNPGMIAGEMARMLPAMYFMSRFGLDAAVKLMGPEAFNAALVGETAGESAAAMSILRASAYSEGLLSASGMAQQMLAQGKAPSNVALPFLGTMITTPLFPLLSGRILPDVETNIALALAGQKILKPGTAINDLVKSFGSGALKESLLEETPQSYFEQIWQNLAADKPLTEGALGAGIYQGFLASFMGGFGNVFAQSRMALAAQANKDLINYKASQNQQGVIDRIIQFARDSKTREWSPEAFQEFAQTLHGPKEMYVSPEAFQDLQDAQELPEYIQSQLDGTGKEVIIPMEKFVTDIVSNEDLLAALRPHLHMEPGGLTQTEMSTPESAELRNLIDQAEQEAEYRGELGDLETDLVNEAIGTKRMSAAEARASVQPLVAYINRVSQEHNLSPRKVWEKMNTRFAGPEGVVGEPEGEVGRGEADLQIPKAVYTRNQNLAGVEITQETFDERKGKKGTIKANAQEMWDRLQEKRSNYEQLWECLHG